MSTLENTRNNSLAFWAMLRALKLNILCRRDKKTRSCKLFAFYVNFAAFLLTGRFFLFLPTFLSSTLPAAAPETVKAATLNMPSGASSLPAMINPVMSCSVVITTPIRSPVASGHFPLVRAASAPAAAAAIKLTAALAYANFAPSAFVSERAADASRSAGIAVSSQ